MKKTSWILFAYSLLIIIGGVIGHLKAASQASLMTGIGFGGLLLLSSILMMRRKPIGLYLGFALTIILDLFFTYRFVRTHLIFPPAVLSVISLAMVIILGLKIKKMK